MFNKRTKCACAFTLLEVLIVIGIIGALIAILAPTIEGVRERAYRTNCASNLRQITSSLRIYADDNQAYPRTRYVAGAPLVEGTGASASDPFGAAGPDANDTAAALFLLMRSQKLPPAIMMCPYNDIFSYVPEAANPATRSNFTDYKKSLGYSYANPYPDAAAASAGYRLSNSLKASFVVAADANRGSKDVTNGSGGSVKGGNSLNHERDGQNVGYADGRVEWRDTPFCGMNGDNIYRNKNGQIEASPVDRDDSILLPSSAD